MFIDSQTTATDSQTTATGRSIAKGKRRIIVACGGISQSASRGDDSIPANVRLFCDALSKSGDVEQLVFCRSGVGTQDLDDWATFIQNPFGRRLEVNITDGYFFIMNNYEPGDELFIFGFSRGAFAARVLANIIARLGVISEGYLWAFEGAMKAYKDNKLEDFKIQMEREHKNWVTKVDIEVVGCWDTVASLGIPWKLWTDPGGVSGEYKNFNGGLVKGIKRAFHALALDECRRPFTPNLWSLEDLEAEDRESVDLQQCWFPGVHGNVGGGYSDRALSDLSLAWMIDLCRSLLDFDIFHLKLIAYLRRNPEEWHKMDLRYKVENDTGIFNNSYQGYGRGRCYDSYKEGQTWIWKYRTPLEYGDGGLTKETMHASVWERWQAKEDKSLMIGPAVWKPTGFEPSRKWVKKGPKGQAGEELVIDEAPFPAAVKRSSTKEPRSFERLLRFGSFTGDSNDGDE